MKINSIIHNNKPLSNSKANNPVMKLNLNRNIESSNSNQKEITMKTIDVDEHLKSTKSEIHSKNDYNYVIKNKKETECQNNINSNNINTIKETFRDSIKDNDNVEKDLNSQNVYNSNTIKTINTNTNYNNFASNVYDGASSNLLSDLGFNQYNSIEDIKNNNRNNKLNYINNNNTNNSNYRNHGNKENNNYFQELKQKQLNSKSVLSKAKKELIKTNFKDIINGNYFSYDLSFFERELINEIPLIEREALIKNQYIKFNKNCDSYCNNNNTSKIVSNMMFNFNKNSKIKNNSNYKFDDYSKELEFIANTFSKKDFNNNVSSKGNNLIIINNDKESFRNPSNMNNYYVENQNKQFNNNVLNSKLTHLNNKNTQNYENKEAKSAEKGKINNVFYYKFKNSHEKGSKSIQKRVYDRVFKDKGVKIK